MAPIESLDFGERWLRDGLHEAAQAGAWEAIDADTTEATIILKHLKAIDRRVTWTHIFVRAVSLVLTANPDLHKLVAGNKKSHPDSVDVCISLDSDLFVTPVLVIQDAGRKDIFTIAREVVERAPEVLAESERMLAILRRWGWVVPLSCCRRALLGFLMRRIQFRRKVSGTFQISCLPQVDVFAPMIFNTAGVLGIGRVRDRVVALNGVPVVRSTVTLTCSLDHSVWNGMDCARFLTALKEVVESGDFVKGVAPVKVPVAAA